MHAVFAVMPVSCACVSDLVKRLCHCAVPWCGNIDIWAQWVGEWIGDYIQKYIFGNADVVGWHDSFVMK